MKEDILEQLVDDYLQSEGYFTRHNLKFRPDQQHPEFVKDKDSNHSDIDVLGFHPMKTGHERVYVVSCKSWQGGFSVTEKITDIERNKIRSGRRAELRYRELLQHKWSEAFVRAVEAATGSREFTYITAVTKIRGDRRLWEQHPKLSAAMSGNPIRLIELSEMVERIWPQVGTTLASSQLGRLLQVMKASGCIEIRNKSNTTDRPLSARPAATTVRLTR